MNAWGVAPARGHRMYCASCGTVIGFAEKDRRGRFSEESTARITLATQKHVDASPFCRGPDAIFVGAEIIACRCERRVLVTRADGLFCARCEGLVAPDAAGPPVGRRPRSGGAT
jgi:hypothetical protein